MTEREELRRILLDWPILTEGSQAWKFLCGQPTTDEDVKLMLKGYSRRDHSRAIKGEPI